MAIILTLNPKNDQLVPINALKKWSAEHLEEVQDESFLKRLFDKAAKRPKTFRERAGELNNIIKKLPAPTQEKGGRVWFLKVFLEPFGQKITDEAKEIFEVLSKGWFGNKSSFAELEKAAEEYNGRLKTATTNVATSAMALNNLLMNEMGTTVRDFAIAYKQAKQAAQTSAQAQPAQAQPAQLDQVPVQESLKSMKLTKRLYEAGLVDRSEYLASLIQTKTALSETKSQYSGGYGKREVQKSIADAQKVFDVVAKTTNNQVTKELWKQEFLKQLQTNIIKEDATDDGLSQYGYTPDVIESIWKDYISTDRRNAGKIAAAAAAAAAAPAEAAAAAPAEAQASQNTKEDAVDKGIVTLIGTEEKPTDGEIAKLGSIATGIQDAMTRFAQGIITEALSFKQQQFAKLHTKKLVLSEYIETGKMPTKTQLNEFIISGLILAALAGALAWVASKFGAIFKGAYPTGTSDPSHSSGDKPDIGKTLPNITNGLAAGFDAKGNLVDIQGRKVPPVKDEIAKLTKDIPTIQKTIDAGVNEISKSDSYKVVTFNQVQSQLARVTGANRKLASAVAKLTVDLQNLLQEAAKT